LIIRSARQLALGFVCLNELSGMSVSSREIPGQLSEYLAKTSDRLAAVSLNPTDV
jgi:hypothetical protein